MRDPEPRVTELVTAFTEAVDRGDFAESQRLADILWGEEWTFLHLPPTDSRTGGVRLHDGWASAKLALLVLLGAVVGIVILGVYLGAM